MTPLPSDEEFAYLIESETHRIGPVVGVRWETGYAIIAADALVRMPQAQVNKLFGGTPNEKRKNVRHR